MTNEMIVFEAMDKIVATSNAKTGATGLRLQTKKEFAETYIKANPKASSNTVKRAYNEYFKAGCRANTAGLAAKLTTGLLGVKSFVTNKAQTETTVKFVHLDKLADEKAEIIDNLAKLDSAALQEIVAAANARLAANAN